MSKVKKANKAQLEMDNFGKKYSLEDEEKTNNKSLEYTPKDEVYGEYLHPSANDEVGGIIKYFA